MSKVKEILEVLKAAGKFELMSDMNKLWEQNTQQREEIIQLKEENSELNKALELLDKIEFKNGVYWLQDEQGKSNPCCPKCYDDEKKTIHMSIEESDSYWCPKCKVTYYSRRNPG